MEKANSEVVTSFDPSLFEWHDGNSHKWKPSRNMTVRVDKHGFYLSKGTVEKIVKSYKPIEAGIYVLEVGRAKKAIAFREGTSKSKFRFRMKDEEVTGVYIRCRRFVEELSERLNIPATLTATWDERNKMLVAKFPGADDKPKRKVVPY